MDSQKLSANFDFEQWAELAHTDPEGFEASRSAAIEAAISRAPARTQARLRRLQWKVDQVRRISANPLAACIEMNKMMWDRFAGEGGLVESLHGLQDGSPPPSRRPEPARIIPLRR